MAKREKGPEKGLSFPPGEKGDRSTTTAGKNIIAAAIRGSKAPDSESLAAKCAAEKNWRFKYQTHFMNLVRLSAYSPEAAVGAAQAGIDYMHKNFEFVNPSNPNDVQPFSEYMKKAVPPFATGEIQGKNKGGKELVVPYKGKELTGEPLKKQFLKWAKYGTIEPDAAKSLCDLVDKGKLDLKDQHFILIGAGSAMGPYTKLLEHGATVIAVDVPGKWGARPAEMWQRLFDIARNSSGRLLYPVTGSVAANATDAERIQAAGCNLTEQPSEILSWIVQLSPGARFTIGNYTYLDGDLHVKLALAADALIAGLVSARKDTAVAFLCTPTDIHLIPDQAYEAAVRNYGFHPGKGIEFLINLLSLGKLLRKNALKPIKTADGSTLKVVDGLSVAQGPNYALAKRLQHWRAIVEYNAGRTVSSNIAPSTATLSVVSNRTFAWAYGGMPYFKPYEIFQQETTNAIMEAMLVADVTLKDSSANPANKAKYGIKNPLELFKFGSVHGGVWRAAYKVDSIGEISALIYFLGGPKAFLPIVYTLLALIAGAIYYFLSK